MARHIRSVTQAIVEAENDDIPKSIVMCVDITDSSEITVSALLLGIYLIVYKDEVLQNLQNIFRKISPSFVEFQNQDQESLSVFDFWQSLTVAKDAGWMDVQTGDSGNKQQMNILFDENASCDRLHLIIPSELFIYTVCGKKSGSGNAPDETMITSFHNLNVHVVVCCGVPTTDYSELLKAGISVEDLPYDTCRPEDLRPALGRLIRLSHICPGAIVLNTGSDLALAESLVSSYLIKKHAFDTPSALAWVRMLSPLRETPTLCPAMDA
jgi:hypothetical protein